MTDEEIKLRCIEMAAARTPCNIRTVVFFGDAIFKVVYPYLKEGKLPEEDSI